MKDAVELMKTAFLEISSGAATVPQRQNIEMPGAAGKMKEKRLAELGEIVAGRQRDRLRGEEVTVFKSVGNAAQDLVAAHRILANARALGLGVEIER